LSDKEYAEKLEKDLAFLNDEFFKKGWPIDRNAELEAQGKEY